MLALIVLASLAWLPSRSAGAAADPSGQFLDAYYLVQDGDAAEKQSDWVLANAKFTAALKLLQEIHAAAPEWNPHIIEFRLKYCADHLLVIQPNLPARPAEPAAAAPAAPAGAPEPATAPPTPTADRLQELSAQVQRLKEENQLLEDARKELSAKLQEALTKSTKAGSSVDDLLKQKEELTSQLAASHKQVADLNTRVEELQKAQEQIRQLETERDDLQSKLRVALSQQAQPAEVEALLKKNEQLAAQLAARQQPTTTEGASAAPASASVRLRMGLKEVQDELARTRQELRQTKRQTETLQKELTEVRADNVQLRRSYNEVLVQLKESDRQLRSARTVNEKNDQIIRFLRNENELLQHIVEEKRTITRAGAAPAETRIPELKGWSHRPARKAAAPAPPAEPAMSESAHHTLVATMKAPPISTPEPPQPPPAEKVAAPADQPAAPETNVVTVAEATDTPMLVTEPARQLFQAGNEAFAHKDYETAAARYTELLKLEPKNVTAMANLGVTRYHQSRLDEAEEILRQTLTLAPYNSVTHTVLGVVALRKNRLDDAFAELTRGVALDPHNAEAHNYLGITLSEKGLPAGAEQEIRKAVEINPRYADAHFNLAVLYARDKAPHYALARYHYEKAVDLGAPPDPQLESVFKNTAPPAP